MSAFLVKDLAHLNVGCIYKMTNVEILLKLISIAKENNWLMYNEDRITRLVDNKSIEYKEYYGLIFDQDFLSKVLGKEWICDTCGGDVNYHPTFCRSRRPTYLWEYHLTRMVKEKNPLQYLINLVDKK